MDRDKRWERVAKGLQGDDRAKRPRGPRLHGPASGPIALQAVRKSHEAGKSRTSSSSPRCLEPEWAMQDGDSVVFFNYRSDRAREISAAITEPAFSEFDRGRGFKPSMFAGMATYDQNLKHAAVAYGRQNQHIMGQWLESRRSGSSGSRRRRSTRM